MLFISNPACDASAAESDGSIALGDSQEEIVLSWPGLQAALLAAEFRGTLTLALDSPCSSQWAHLVHRECASLASDMNKQLDGLTINLVLRSTKPFTIAWMQCLDKEHPWLPELWGCSAGFGNKILRRMEFASSMRSALQECLALPGPTTCSFRFGQAENLGTPSGFDVLRLGYNVLRLGGAGLPRFGAGLRSFAWVSHVSHLSTSSSQPC